MSSNVFKPLVLLQVVLFFAVVTCQEELYPRTAVIPPPRRPIPELANNNIGWANGFMTTGLMTTARSFVASPTGQMAVQMAKEFISRSGGGSQVLSLNLTSLLIIVLLKALIFSTGLLGAGNYSQYGRGRGLEGNSIVDSAEMNLFIGFLAAEGSNNDGCLYRAVCLAPEHGDEYLKAGTALLEGFGLFDPTVPRSQRYNEYLQNVRQAVLEGMQMAPCREIYSCNI